MSETSDVPFRSEEVDALTDRLSRFASALSPEEWRLLLAILDSASSNFEQVADTPPKAPASKDAKRKPSEEMTAKQLRDKLRKTYIPGKPPPRKKYQVTPPQITPPRIQPHP
jgi:hypothetical protein